MSDDCPICLEPYKGKRNPKITCQHCPSHACRQCQQRHLLITHEDPHCVSCKRGWNSDFMGTTFPISFRNGPLRAHRRKILFEREKSLLPSLQIYAEYRRKIEELTTEKNKLHEVFGNEYVSADTVAFKYTTLRNRIFAVNYNIDKQRKEIRRLRDEDREDPSRTILLEKAKETRDGLKVVRDKLEEEFVALQPRYLELQEEYDRVSGELRRFTNLYHDKEATVERREFVMRCPAEECRGFLSTSYKCGTCEGWTCVDCHVPLGKDKHAEHTCNADDILSAKAIKDETKPCPKCGTRIFKIDGCDQIWCVVETCHTAFSWKTGTVVTGVIHNPHYYEWLRRKEGGEIPREAGDIPCGGMPTTWQMVAAIRNIEMPNEIATIVLENFRNLQDLIEGRMRDYPSRLPQLANKENDVHYLLNEITEEVWQHRLERTESKFLKKKEIGQILQTLATAGSDMMNRIYDRAIQAFESGIEAEELFVEWVLNTAVPELEQLRVFGNDSLLALARRDRMAVPQFDSGWAWKGLRAIYSSKSAHSFASTAAATEIVQDVS